VTMKKTIELLRKTTLLEVGERLTPGQCAAVRQGYAVQRCYQDFPPDVPYSFRPVKYYLMASDRLREWRGIK